MSRLIDADKLIERMKEDTSEAKKKIPQFEYVDKEVWQRVIQIIESYIDIIKQQPTAYDVDKVVEQIEKQKNLIDKWEKRLEILDEAYIKNLRDKIETKEKKFNKHMTIITRISELEMCIKDLKQLGGGLDESN